MSTPPLSIASGTCYALFAYDIAQAIDLDEAERHIGALKYRAALKHRRRAPKYFAYHPAPLRVTQDVDPIGLGPYRTASSVDLVLYDFGAVLVVYTIPLTGSLSRLLTLSNELYDNVLLLSDARKQVEELLAVIHSAAFKADIADFVEDYTIFQIEAFTTACDVNALCTTYAQEIAQILRAEAQVLSPQEVGDALAYRISYGADDVTIVDWNAALLLDREGDDVRAVLEFANVELLEMRYLDQRLDDALDRSYDALSKQRRTMLRLRLSYRADLQRMAQMQVDSAILFEGVNNALKLLGDQYLSRIYRLVSQRFHLAEWDAGILRKLQTLESIYEKVSDQASNRRMEVLEWIIIVLIALSIVLSFIPGGLGH
ncbi:MAG TPA: hypothetical protein VNP04_30460 [Alphaproteobacteria bacterium]|nr:hypothetical protein [Alphaproteobacteria bacterium]